MSAPRNTTCCKLARITQKDLVPLASLTKHARTSDNGNWLRHWVYAEVNFHCQMCALVGQCWKQCLVRVGGGGAGIAAGTRRKNNST